MSGDAPFYFDNTCHNTWLAKVWLGLAKAYTQFALGHVLRDEHDRVVVEADHTLYMYGHYKYHMAKLSLSVPPEEEEAMQSAEDMRLAHASAQKNKEDQESLQRINEYFSALENKEDQ